MLNRAEAYFLPGLLTGILTAVICGVSVVAGRPLVAWTSHIVRRWPLGWYWHPRVRPAYSEVTIAWAVFFAAKLALQFLFFQEAQAGALAIFTVITGWPATIALLERASRLETDDGPVRVVAPPEDPLTEKERLQAARIGQGDFRNALVVAWGGTCPLAGVDHLARCGMPGAAAGSAGSVVGLAIA